MNKLFTLVKRNIKLYFCDRGQVFFSLLGALIAIVLVLTFLKSSIVDEMVASFNGLADKTQATHVLDTWLVASACVIASATTALGALRQFVADRQSARWRDLLVTPLPRWMITLGYLLSALVVSALMTTVVYLLGTGYCVATGAPLSVTGVLTGWGWLLLSCLGFTSLMGLIVSALRTDGAFNGVSVIIGVMFGFLAETYVTASSLPSGATHTLASLPFAQASALVRAPYTASSIAALPEQLRAGTASSMGITLSIGSTTLSAGLFAAVLVVMAVVCTLAASQVMARTVRR